MHESVLTFLDVSKRPAIAPSVDCELGLQYPAFFAPPKAAVVLLELGRRP